MTNQLAEQNIESWKEVVDFYRDFTAESDAQHISPLLRLAEALAYSEQSRYFRAGVSHWHLMISTAPKHGLEEDEPFIGVTLTRDYQQLRIEY